NTRVSSTDLFRCICDEFHIDCAPNDTAADLLRRLQDFLVGRFSDGKPVVLMLDEAQGLSRDAFEQVRMIGNVETDDAKLLQIVIVGQPELRERFEADDMRQLRQRIFRSFHLRGLSREQTEGYIRHRLSVGGAQYPERIFDDAAIDVIFQYSQGLPRLINTVCDNAMLSAYAADQLAIDGPFIQRVIEQMTSVGQGGPRFASPRLPAGDGTPRRRATDVTPTVSTPIPPGLMPQHVSGAAPDAQRFIEEATQAIAAQAQRIRQNVLAEITEAAERMRNDLSGSTNESRVVQARAALENSIERSCVVETRLKSELIETTDALHELVTRAQGLHERLRAVAAETEARIDQAAERAARIQSSATAVTEQLDAVGRRCSPLVGQMRRHTEQTRAVMGELPPPRPRPAKRLPPLSPPSRRSRTRRSASPRRRPAADASPSRCVRPSPASSSRRRSWKSGPSASASRKKSTTPTPPRGCANAPAPSPRFSTRIAPRSRRCATR
ncbi:MAG TPA: AAA family ATPase, partial [Phycisphaerae bacterium]|nr:AAA family ATPase [Phycisphaerae bacterium]